MNLHLAAISADVTQGRHAVLLLDQAGWHLSHKLVVPHNITIVPLPPKCPELNPQENIWQFMRDNWLSNRVFDNGNALIDHCCNAWNNLEAQPWTIMSIGMRDWAHRLCAGFRRLDAPCHHVDRTKPTAMANRIRLHISNGRSKLMFQPSVWIPHCGVAGLETKGPPEGGPSFPIRSRCGPL